MSAHACHLPSRQISTVRETVTPSSRPRFYWQLHCQPPKIFFSQLAFSSGESGWEEEAAFWKSVVLVPLAWGQQRWRTPHGIPVPRSKGEQKVWGGVCPGEVQNPQTATLSFSPPR